MELKKGLLNVPSQLRIWLAYVFQKEEKPTQNYPPPNSLFDEFPLKSGMCALNKMADPLPVGSHLHPTHLRLEGNKFKDHLNSKEDGEDHIEDIWDLVHRLWLIIML